MTASILFGTESKLISLDNKNCTLKNRQKVPCTSINYCLKYDGINVDVDDGKIALFFYKSIGKYNIIVE